MAQFFCKTKIIFGNAAQALQSLDTRRLLLVTDPYFEKTGMAQALLTGSGATQHAIFSQVTPDPSVALAAGGTRILLDFAPDAVVALGGGSAIDCAKAMVFFSKSDALLVAIPTTSGSGSEVTDFSILTHENTKHPLVDSRIAPDVAILDESFLEKLPPSLIADAGFDVLSHALESLVATGGSCITNALAKEAFSTAFAHLPASFAGNTTVRGAIHGASCMAGIAFSQAGLGLCHAISHSLGGMFHIPHGRLNAILLPAVVMHNAQVAGSKYAEIARFAGLGGTADALAVRNLKNALVRLRRSLDLPDTLVQAGIDPRQLRSCIPAVVEAALKDPCSATNPKKPTPALVQNILEEVTGRV